MFSKHLKKPRVSITHNHYTYQGLFNNIYVEIKEVTCSPQCQQTTISEQEQVKDKRTFPDRYKYLIYGGDNFCVYFITTTTFKRPSDAIAARDFQVLELSMDRVLGSSSLSTNKIYVDSSKIKEIFMPEIISFLSFDDCLEDIQTKVDETLQNLTAENREQAIHSIWRLKSSVQKAKCSGLQNKRSINYELPYSEWLYEVTKAQLTPLGFVVNHENTGKPIAPTNEYIFGRRDLIVYHPTKCERHVEALHVGIVPADILCADKNYYTIHKHELWQGVAELKVKSVDSKAENETFYNMFAEAIKLTMKSLLGGHIIVKATVYGIVVATHEHEYATLLKVELNFEEARCLFYKCPDSADFATLLNKVISILDR